MWWTQDYSFNWLLVWPLVAMKFWWKIFSLMFWINSSSITFFFPHCQNPSNLEAITPWLRIFRYHCDSVKPTTVTFMKSRETQLGVFINHLLVLLHHYTSVCSILYIEFTSLSRLLISAINTFSSICWNITENILFTAQCWICYILSFGFCPFLFYFIYIEVLPSDVKFFSFHFLHMSVLLLTCELLVITIGLFPFHLTLPFDLYFPFGRTLLSSCVCIFGILYFQRLLLKLASWEVTCLPVCLCLGELYLSNLCEIPIYPLEDFESVSVFASAWKVYTCMKVQCAG